MCSTGGKPRTGAEGRVECPPKNHQAGSIESTFEWLNVYADAKSYLWWSWTWDAASGLYQGAGAG